MYTRGSFPNLLSYPALGLLECTGIARGMLTCDAIVKRANVQLIQSHPIDPGRYIILFEGLVAEVEEGLDAGELAAGDMLLDKLFLPQVHSAVVPSIRGQMPLPPLMSLAIVETHTIATAVVALDASLKTAQTRAVEIRLGTGIAGKGYFVLTGELYDVQAAVEAAIDTVGSDIITEVIASPHPDFLKRSF